MEIEQRILTLSRQHYYKKSVVGTLSISTMQVCNTLEPLLGNRKGFPVPLIPPGDYSLRFNRDGGMNEHYKRALPQVHRGMIEIHPVAGHSLLYFHIGNYVKETKGCILVGSAIPKADEDGLLLTNSAIAYGFLYAFLAYSLCDISKIQLRIIDNPSNIKINPTTKNDASA